jgi:small subunit ribosomal protein S1
MSEYKEFYIEGEELSMSELLAGDSSNLHEDTGDKIIKAKVVSVNKEDVTVDVGLKSEIFIPISEFIDDDGNLFVKLDDEVEVFVLSRNNNGISNVSYKKAQDIKKFAELKELFKNDTQVKAKVIDNNKGGYVVSIKGIQAFMPISQTSFGQKKEDLMGKFIDIFIIDIKDSNIIVSSRKYDEKVRKEMAENQKKDLQVGMKIKGKVKSIKEYGAFINLGAMDGLLHISDMSWTKVKNVSDIMSIGDTIEVLVTAMDDKKEKISLSLKALQQDPWKKINFNIGDVLEGKVSKILKIGAIISIGENLEGFLHISDLSWVEKIHNISDILKEGDQVKVKVLTIDIEHKKILLGLKQIEESPWEKFKVKYKQGDKIFGKVVSITDFGVFVEIEKGIDGLIHISDVAWNNEKLTKDSFEKGEELEVVILSINSTEQKISLGLKQKQVDPMLKYKLKNNYKCTISKIENDDLIVKLEDGLDGIIPRFYLGINKSMPLTDKYKVDEELEVKLVKMDSKKRELVFSVKDFVKEQEKIELKEYLKKEEAYNPTLGELLSEKFKNKSDDLK